MIELPQLFDKKRRINDRLYMALCPFHEDTAPSLRLAKWQGKWRYTCFSCGVRGDEIDLLQNRDKMTYRQALDALALKEPPPIDLWAPRYWMLLVCDACQDEVAEVRDMQHLVELADGRWEVASDAIAAVGPQCLNRRSKTEAGPMDMTRAEAIEMGKAIREWPTKKD